MKILYVHDNIYRKTEGGAICSPGQFPYSYWEPFLEAFGSVSVIGRGHPGLGAQDMANVNIASGPGVDFHLFPNINTVKGRILHVKKTEEALAGIVAGADGVVIRAVSDLGWLTYKHARALGKPVAMEMAACAWDSTWNHGNRLGKIYAFIRYARDRRMTKEADFVLYVSREFLPGRYPAKGRVDYISNVRIDPVSEKTLEKRLARIKEGHPLVIGLIGTLDHKLKGVHDAIKALAILRKRTDRPFVFRHLGPGESAGYERLARKEGLSDIIQFDGMVPSGEAVLDWLDGVDLYIQPSYQEGVPRAVIEGMSRGCPVIGSTAGGIPELLPDLWLHKPGDYQMLAGLMQKILEDETVQANMARRNFALAKTFTSDVLMPKRRAFWGGFRDYIRAQV